MQRSSIYRVVGSRLRSSARMAAVSVAITLAVCSCSGEGAEDAGERSSTEVQQQGAGAMSGGETRPAPTPVRFYREYVVVEPSVGRTSVRARYYFRNTSDRPLQQAISYPFPVDRFHLYPRVVRVWEETPDGRRPMGFVHQDRSVTWLMRFEPGEEKVVRVDYTQDIVKPHARYIVTTTKYWERPIDLAEFEFRVPTSLDSVHLSFKPDRESVRGDTVVYYMRREEFMPDADLDITWSE